ncbi:hypothetical protein [Psychrobacillus sp. NPDC096389]|uniref:hypothetical protein n=1 Tax=Psychrobacillus sp. NPDC096389 TaxID=3364490 RepID=UPI003800F33A
MIYLTLFLFFLMIGACFAMLIKAIMVAGRGAPKTLLFHNQEQFVTTEPIAQVLPKHQIKNSHWFTHTFMRPRRKG